MRRFLLPAIFFFVMSTLLFGVVYPMLVWSVAHVCFSDRAEGSPVIIDGRIRGFYYVGQSFFDQHYFWGRPSWSYRVRGIDVSGGSNLSWLSPLLRANVEHRSAMWEADFPPEDMIMASASGCDPEISFEAANAQITRVARARGADEECVRALVVACKEDGGDLFPKRVNVLRLNVLLDRKLESKDEDKS